MSAAESDNLPVHYMRQAVGPSVARADHAVRVRAALEARARGYEYYQIADEMGVTTTTAERYVKDGLKVTLREASEEVRKLELKRLDMMMQVYMVKALDGHGPSCDRVLAIMERRARIEGIDAPLEVDFAAVRAEFFGLVRDVLGPEQTAILLQAMVERRPA